MMVTPRDEEVIEFMEHFKVAKTSTIYRLFYPSLRVAQHRLAALTKHKLLTKEKDLYGPENLYYIKKPQQIRHALLLSEFYAEFSSLVTVRKFIVEPEVGDIRPDALVYYSYNDASKAAFVEIELSRKGFDIGKYERLLLSGDYKKCFSSFPHLIVVCDRPLPSTEISFTQVSTDLKDIKNCL